MLASVSLGRERNIISSWLGNEYSVAFSTAILSALRAEKMCYAQIHRMDICNIGLCIKYMCEFTDPYFVL